MKLEFPVPESIAFWDLLNAPITVTVIGSTVGLIGALAAARIARELAEGQKTTRAQQSAAHEREREQQIANEPPPASRDTADYFDRAAIIYREIGPAIAERITKITDGRRRRKYEISNHDYREHIFLLWQDDELGKPAAVKIVDALTKWYAYRNRRNRFPEEAYNELVEARDMLKRTA